MLLAGCGVVPGSHGTLTVSGTAGPAGIEPAGSPSPTGTKSPTPAGGSKPTATKPGSSVAKGCPAGGARIPAGAGQARTPDLDGDGRADTVWVADQSGQRTLGVRTASGAGFTRTFTNSAPQNARATAGRLGDGTAVILLDFSRDVQLYGVTGCQIVVTRNVHGDPYTFDGGFAGYGTGVGCPVIGDSGRRLAGYLATATGSTYTVVRTTINLSRGGAAATNGTVKTLGTGLAADSATVKAAQSVSCGSADSAVEPVS